MYGFVVCLFLEMANDGVNDAYPTVYEYIYIYTTELWVRVLIFSGVKVSGIYIIVAWKARLFHIHTFVWNPCLETQLRDGSVQQS